VRFVAAPLRLGRPSDVLRGSDLDSRAAAAATCGMLVDTSRYSFVASRSRPTPPITGAFNRTATRTAQLASTRDHNACPAAVVFEIYVALGVTQA
jgi:hypothetical protein